MFLIVRIILLFSDFIIFFSRNAIQHKGTQTPSFPKVGQCATVRDGDCVSVGLRFLYRVFLLSVFGYPLLNVR